MVEMPYDGGDGGIVCTGDEAERAYLLAVKPKAKKATPVAPLDLADTADAVSAKKRRPRRSPNRKPKPAE